MEVYKVELFFLDLNIKLLIFKVMGIDEIIFGESVREEKRVLDRIWRKGNILFR